jgi:hypothetical protein
MLHSTYIASLPAEGYIVEWLDPVATAHGSARLGNFRWPEPHAKLDLVSSHLLIVPGFATPENTELAGLRH